MKKTVYSVLLGLSAGVIDAVILLEMNASAGYILQGFNLVLAAVIAMALPQCLRLFSWNQKLLLSQILMTAVSFVIMVVYAQYVSGSQVPGADDAGTALRMIKTMGLVQVLASALSILLYFWERKRNKNETV